MNEANENKTITNLPNVRICWIDIETNKPTKYTKEIEIFEFACITQHAYTFETIQPLGSKLTPNQEFHTHIYSDIIAKRYVNKGWKDIPAKHRPVLKAKKFHELADEIFVLLHNAIWAGHNINTFDSVHIRKAFETLGRAPPVPVRSLDTYRMLSRNRDMWNKLAGDLKLASLAKFFKLGDQTHCALDDVKLNMKVFEKASQFENGLYCDLSKFKSTQHRNTYKKKPVVTITSEIVIDDDGSHESKQVIDTSTKIVVSDDKTAKVDNSLLESTFDSDFEQITDEEIEIIKRLEEVHISK